MHIEISHTTEYLYTAPVSYALQKVRLRPLSSGVQEVVDWSVTVSGGKIENQYIDHYGNHVDLVSLDPGGQALSIRASGSVETKCADGVTGKIYTRAPLWHFREPTAATEPGAEIRDIAGVLTRYDTTLDGLHGLSAAILEKVPYTLGATHSHTTAEEALTSGGGGVCQDHAQIFISAARVAGIPARYVSGYLMMNDRVDQDATHAWAEAHVDGLGWVGFDISNGYSPDERYVRIAIGRDARDASPIEGLRLGAAEEELIVSLQVQQ
ncbi:Transglutaminase-like superfamily protein [Sulfitobacter sp. THAF37]|uniref:transglutaminase family protein n=1 Tax=Sulfitobacter sp. THAF37 TaxID=2587855 RepID=UPI0012680B0C|nr:transglutaminase family protein [Sulfitobacter sp. THAF37]QFT59935.1 Transglutaminase-like superfamily protein [Sulfitobacter sp. THAF37]